LLTPLSAVNPYVEIKRQANIAAVFHSINGIVHLILSFFHSDACGKTQF